MINPILAFFILLVLNLPIFAFIAWIMFDDLRDSETMVAGLIKALIGLISCRLLFAQLAGDDDNSMFNMVVVLGACVLIMIGEFAAIAAWWPDLIAM